MSDRWRSGIVRNRAARTEPAGFGGLTCAAEAAARPRTRLDEQVHDGRLAALEGDIESGLAPLRPGVRIRRRVRSEW